MSQLIWFKLSKGDSIFPAHFIARNMMPTLCRMLPSFHALTVCDNQLYCKAGKTQAMETA